MRLAAGLHPDSLRELTALPRPSSWIWEGLWREGMDKDMRGGGEKRGGGRRKGKEERVFAPANMKIVPTPLI